jgi:hypothetical protein
VSSVSNGMYFLTLPLVRVMRVIYRKIRHARYLYIKRNVEKVWGARYTLGACYLSKNTVLALCCRNSTCDYFLCSSFVLNSMLLHIYLFLAQHNVLVVCSGKICQTAVKIFFACAASCTLHRTVLLADSVCCDRFKKLVKCCCATRY